jgi:glutathione S-transferase
MTVTLYEISASPNARKVRLLAAELGIPLMRVEMDFKRGDFRTPEFLARNPNGMIPVVDDDGFVVWESAAIMNYLASKAPERGLHPDSAKDRARLDQWLYWWTSQPEPALARIAFERRVKPWLGLPGNDPVLIADAESALARFLPVLDTQLAGKDYVLGKLSLMEFIAVPRLENAPSALSIPLDRYANITAWIKRMQARPYWKDA